MKILSELNHFDVKLLDYIIDVEVEHADGSVTTNQVDMRSSLISLYYMLTHSIKCSKLIRLDGSAILLPTILIVKMLKNEKSIVIIDSLIKKGFLDELLLFSVSLPKSVERMTMDELNNYSELNINTIEFFQESFELIVGYLTDQIKERLSRSQSDGYWGKTFIFSKD